jgi:GT2 family glycosyltransferase
MVSIIIPSRTVSYLIPCLASIRLGGLGQERIVVVESGLSKVFQESLAGEITFVSTPQPFVFARAMNEGVRQARPTSHLLLLNDDTEILTPQFAAEIELAFHLFPNVGVLGCRIQGGCGLDEQRMIGTSETCLLINKTVCFVAVAIRRQCWEAVGEMDEQFTGYGYDDDDYCRRAVLAGWELGLTGLVTVKHGAPGYQHSSSYMRYHADNGDWMRMGEANRQRFQAKYPEAPWNIHTGAIHEKK